MNGLEFSYPFALNERAARLAVSLRLEYLEPSKGVRPEFAEIESMEHLGFSALKKLEGILVKAFEQALEEWNEGKEKAAGQTAKAS